MLRTLALYALSVSSALAVDAPPFHWRGSVPSGGTLELRGVNGNIRAEAASGSEAEVHGVITARRSDPNQVRVEVENKSGNVVICVLYPSDSVSGSGCDRRQNTKNNDTNVNFTVRLPRGTRLVARTVNGNVTTSRLESPIEAKTVNGRIELTTTETAAAQTVNGSIRAVLGKLSSDSEFTTVNGGIELSLPPNAGANLDASVVNGDIEPDFPLTLSGKISKRHVTGRLGSGGPGLSVKTVNGSIQIKQSSLI